MPDEPIQSYGEKAVGLSFNPSGDSAVDTVKRLYAEIINIINNRRSDPGNIGEKSRFFSIAITEAQTAHIWAVKAITWKD